MKVPRDCDGLSLRIPVRNAQIFGYLSIGSLLITSWYAEIADRCAFTVRYWSSSQIYLKVYKMDQFCLTHQLVHLFQAICNLQ